MRDRHEIHVHLPCDWLGAHPWTIAPCRSKQGAPASAAGASQQKAAKSGGSGKNLGNDGCDKKVRQKYPSGTLGNNQRLQFVLACRDGKPW